MSHLDLGLKAIAFAEEAADAGTLLELQAVVRRAIAPLGLDAASCATVSGPTAAPTRRFLFLDWPDAWLGLYREENFFDIDPIPRWALTSGSAASFTQVASRLPRYDPGRRVVQAARANRFGEGLLVPSVLPNGAVGIVSLGGDRDAFGPHERAFLEIVSHVMFMRASTLDHRNPRPFNAGLTPRELDCIALLVRGLTDRDMAERLGIGEPTVRFHLNAARRKTGAKSRTHLAALATWLGLSHL